MEYCEDVQFWFGFRQTSPKPPGTAVVCGPYKSLKEASSERDKMRAWDAALSVPFTAKSREEAESRVDELTGRI